MRLISRLLILVGFFIFFTYCGDNNSSKYPTSKEKTSNIKYDEIPPRFATVNTETAKDKISYKKKKVLIGDKSTPNQYIKTNMPKARRELITKNLKNRGVFGNVSDSGESNTIASFNGRAGNEFIAGRGSGGTGFRGIGTGGGGSVYPRLKTGDIAVTRVSLSKGRKGEFAVRRFRNTERYSEIKENPLKRTIKQPVSTFSIDVDTASYSIVRSMIENGGFNKNAVRAEEFINYFTYNYPQPENNKPFSVTTEVGPSILHKNRSIIHIGIQGRKKADEKRKSANLVFLIDTSGSMQSYNKLPLLKESLNILINNLSKKDIITIVTYAGDSRVALNPTKVTAKNIKTIKNAINSLEPYGGTNGEGGIIVAYNKAKENFDKNKINRIILCTDGDFNIGVSSISELKDLIKNKRKTGITLSTVGFGRGNYNDALMEKLADNGNGNYFYINNINEAKKVFTRELTANLEVIAKDVKIQVEFNPQKISYYKLIGYENRILKNEDFKNDKIDAGEIGSGHTVTALYEVVFADNPNQPLDKLRYQNKQKTNSENSDNKSSKDEIAYVKLRYKKPNGDKSILTTYPVYSKYVIKNLSQTSDNFRFSSAVAAFALNLRNSDNTEISNNEIIRIAENSKGSDEFGYRKEFIEFVKKVK